MTADVPAVEFLRSQAADESQPAELRAGMVAALAVLDAARAWESASPGRTEYATASYRLRRAVAEYDCHAGLWARARREARG